MINACAAKLPCGRIDAVRWIRGVYAKLVGVCLQCILEQTRACGVCLNEHVHAVYA
jgi:hypothetical protein